VKCLDSVAACRFEVDTHTRLLIFVTSNSECVINLNRILMKLQFDVNYVYCLFMNVGNTYSDESYAVKTKR
jgi:hypothetical protein